MIHGIEGFLQVQQNHSCIVPLVHLQSDIVCEVGKAAVSREGRPKSKSISVQQILL